jgi:hypothetical protein
VKFDTQVIESSLQQIGAGKCKVRAKQEAHPEVDRVCQDTKAAKYCFGIDDMSTVQVRRLDSEAHIPEVDEICQDTKAANTVLLWC